jgi:hypothetical protein
MVWSLQVPEGKAPEGRAFHQMQMLNESSVIVSGGISNGLDGEQRLFNDLFVLDLKSMQWVEPRTGGTFPSPRYAHTLALHGEEETEVVIFGGIQAKNALTVVDIHVLRCISKLVPLSVRGRG